MGSHYERLRYVARLSRIRVSVETATTVLTVIAFERGDRDLIHPRDLARLDRYYAALDRDHGGAVPR
ncbi:MAG: hypothetical protein HYZ29_13960 [Myxococcales bacterium]|nr:hypothetical protein [Myxococcales bacterium]